MAYIAPSLWAVNQYGEGLRSLVRRGRHLDRWLDFKSHQVFEDVITYTALQFFTREPRDAVRIAAAPNGEMADIDWSDAGTRRALRRHSGDRRMADGHRRGAGADRAARARLSAARRSVADERRSRQGFRPAPTTSIISNGLGADRYKCTPKGKGAVPYEVEIEDAIMKPLVSGPEAKRYEEPETDTYLLFPYERDARGAMRLIPADDMARRFPQAWAHLRRWEQELRERESQDAFDDEDLVSFRSQPEHRQAGYSRS